MNQFSFMEGMVAVTPKLDCPHCTSDHVTDVQEFIGGPKVTDPCKKCEVTGEVWICLKCQEVLCSRYVNGHMAEHFQEDNNHPICFSFADFSYWCNLCQEYIEHSILNHKSLFYDQKFGDITDPTQIVQIIKQSKHQNVINEDDNEEGEDE